MNTMASETVSSNGEKGGARLLMIDKAVISMAIGVLGNQPPSSSNPTVGVIRHLFICPHLLVGSH